MEYKIETKPSYWHIILYKGEYSDYTENHYFIHANDRDEAWFLFKEFWELTPEPLRTSDCMLVLKDAEQREIARFAPSWAKAALLKYGYTEEDLASDEFNGWSIEYGNAWSVNIEQLNVIEFKK